MASFKEVVFQMVARGELSAAQALALVRNVRAESAEGARGVRGGGGPSPAWPPVAVVGIAGCFPGARDVEQFWQNLRAGKATTGEVPEERWSVTRFYDPDASKPGKTNCKWGGFLEGFDLFDPLFFQISPKEAELMDPQQRLFLTQAWKALEDAGYAGDDSHGRPWGVFVGAGGGDYVHKLSAEGAALDGYAFMGNSPSILAARIAYLLDLKGPCLTVDTACSSSLTAIHLACESVALGTSEMAIAGGVCVLTTPNFYLAGSKTGMLSPRGQCRAFDEGADGFVPGEAAGVVVLKSLERAVRDGDHVYGVIEGSAINQDGRTNGITAPSAPSQTALELEVYRKFGIDPSTVGYVEAHGTGTRLGDPIEIEALTRAFRRHTDRRGFCAVGSVKTNVGHTMTAAGVVSVIKVLLALKHRQLPPSLNFERPNAAIPFDDSPFFVNHELRDWQSATPRRAAVNSFGFSGTNVHMVLAEAPPRPAPQPPPRPFRLVTLSAKTESALRERRAQLAEWARLQPDGTDVAHVSFTLNVGRSHFERRLALVVKDRADLVAQFGQQDASEAAPRTADESSLPSASEARQLLERLRDAAHEPEDDYKKGLLLLADLYMRGQEIEWSRLYSGPERRRVPLPTYPFDEHRCQVAGRRGPKLLPALHPLLDRVTPAAGGLVFRATLERSMPPLRDHVVRGSSILPGVALIEMARAAGDALEDMAGVERLEDVCFLRPLTVGDEPQPVTLTLRADENTDSRRVSFEIAREGAALHVYCRGSLVLRRAAAGDGAPTAAARVNVKAIESRCDQGRVEASALYRTFAEAGVECGPFCRGVRHVLLGEAEALGELFLPEEELRGLEHYGLHPTLMDGAFQTAMALQGRAAGSVMVPFSVGEAEVYAPLTPRCFAYVRKSSDGQRAGEARFNIAVVDEAGRVLVRMKNFCAREFVADGPAPRQPKAAPPKPAEDAPQPDGEPVSYYQPAWVEKPFEAGTPAGAGVVVIFHHAQDFGLPEALAEGYGERSVLQVLLGEEYRTLAPGKFEIDHRRERDYERLVESLKPVDGIYFLGGLQDPTAGSITREALDEAEERGVLSLLRLSHALPKRRVGAGPLGLKVVTNDVQAVSEGDAVVPLAAGVVGFAKTLSRELTDVRVSLTDVSAVDLAGLREGAAEAGWLSRALRAEAANEPGLEVALRAGRRYVKALRRTSLSEDGLTSPFREGGFYVLAGGAGGLGLEVARFLASRHRARLLLLGRGALDDSRREQLRELETGGASVKYEQVDVADERALREVLSEARRRWGRINGVIHAAMVLRDRTAAALDEQTCREVLRPKTRGSLALWRAVEEDGPDFFAFFSSANSFFGSAGQSNYAAASTFQDAFALHLARRQGPAIKLFNWGFWGEVGAVASPVYRRRVMRHGVGSIGCGEGIEAFRLLMSGSLTQAMPIKISDATLSKMGIPLAEAKTGEGRATPGGAAGRATREETARGPAETVTSRGDEPAGLSPATRAHVEQTLREQVALVVKLNPEEIRDDKPFSEYGVDSIMGADLVSRINVALGLGLSPTVLFDYSCLKELAAHVLAEGGARLRPQPDDATPVALFQSAEELFGTAGGADGFEPDRLDELLQQLADGRLDAESAHRRIVLAGNGGNGRHKGGVRP